MPLITYAHTAGTAFATKTTLNAADLNDNFFGTDTTTGIVELFNPASSTNGLDSSNIHAQSGFLPWQFKEPYGRAIVNGRATRGSMTSPTYSLNFVQTPATPVVAGNQAKYLVLDAFTMPENGIISRIGVNVGTIIDVAANVDYLEPMLVGVLIDQLPQPDLDKGVRQFALKNKMVATTTITELVADEFYVQDTDVLVNKGSTVYVVAEAAYRTTLTGAVTVDLDWEIHLKLLQRDGVRQ